MIDLQTIPKRDGSFCERELGEETIFLSPQGDQIHALDEIGTFIWKQLDGETALGEVIDRLCNEYDVPRETAEKDLLAFVGDLAENKLLAAD
jgi:coenzyme PQQ synthesis protein D (PqqD)